MVELFAVLITVTFAFVFNTVQSNTIAESLKTQYNVSPITGIILAIVTAIIIFGGVKYCSIIFHNCACDGNYLYRFSCCNINIQYDQISTNDCNYN